MSVPKQSPAQSNNTNPGGDCAHCREHLAAFVLKALDLFDQGLIEQHIRWCDDCRIEIAKLEDVVNRLGAASDDVGAPDSATWSAIRGRLYQSDDDTPVAMIDSEIAAERSDGRKRSWTRFLPATVITSLLVVVLVLGTWTASLRGDLDQREAELSNRSLVESSLVESGQVQLYSVQQSCPSCEGVGQVGVSESNGMGMLVGWDFDPDMQHDVWGISDSGERSPVCQLVVESNGSVMQMFRFPDRPSTFTDIYITDQLGEIVYVSHIVAGDAKTDDEPIQESPTT